MEYEEYTVRNNTYRVVPITFQSYNAKGLSDYEKGFEPDILMDETNPYNEQGVFYIHKDYGNNEEPLYANDYRYKSSPPNAQCSGQYIGW